MDAKAALMRLLYGEQSPRQNALGFAQVSCDIESMLAASDVRAHLIVRAQDENEDATHFEWIGRCGEYGFHLEVSLLADGAFVEVHEVLRAEDVANKIAGMKSKPMLLGV